MNPSPAPHGSRQNEQYHPGDYTRPKCRTPCRHLPTLDLFEVVPRYAEG